jgi:hypothetical protein
MSDDRLALAQVAPLFAMPQAWRAGSCCSRRRRCDMRPTRRRGNGSSASVFGEAITTPLLFGIVLILGGLLLVAS